MICDRLDDTENDIRIVKQLLCSLAKNNDSNIYVQRQLYDRELSHIKNKIHILENDMKSLTSLS